MSHLDERSTDQEAVSEANLDTTEQRGYTTAVDGEVREVVGYDGCRGDGGLQHTNERVTIERLNHLLLHLAGRT
jgi:hypothetical protein